MVDGRLLWDLRKLSDVVIPEGIQRIGRYWFSGSGVERITIPASVEEIGEEAFRMCGNLQCVVFAKGGWLRAIRAEAFRGCCSLKHTEFPDTLKEIGHEAFRESGLESLTAPKSLKQLDSGAFTECRSLRVAELNEGLEDIGNSCFSQTGLE